MKRGSGKERSEFHGIDLIGVADQNEEITYEYVIEHDLGRIR